MRELKRKFPEKMPHAFLEDFISKFLRKGHGGIFQQKFHDDADINTVFKELKPP